MAKKGMCRLLVAILALSLALTFTGYGFSQSPASKVPDRLICASPVAGSAIYMVAVGLTQLYTKYLGIPSIVQPYPGPTAVLKSLHDGKSHFTPIAAVNAHAFTYGIISSMQPEVKEAWPEIRLLIGGHFAWWGWVTRPDTGIKTISDFRGHTINYVVPGNRIQWAIGDDCLRAAGLDPKKDVKLLEFDDSPAAAKALQDKKIDVFFGALETSYINEVKATRGLVVIPFPPEIFDRLRPELKATHALIKLSPGYIAAVDKEQYVIGRRMIIVSRDDLNEDLVYRMVKATMDHAKELLSVAPVFREYGVKQYALPAESIIPFHPGTIRYFKEAGMWTPADEARQKEMLKDLPKARKS